MLCSQPAFVGLATQARESQSRRSIACSICHPSFHKYKDLATMYYPFRNYPSPGCFCCCSVPECKCRGCQARQCSCAPPPIAPSGRAIYPSSYFDGPSTSSCETDVCARWRPSRNSIIIGHPRFPKRVPTTTSTIQNSYGYTTALLASRILDLSDGSCTRPPTVTSFAHHSPPLRVQAPSPIDGSRGPMSRDDATQSMCDDMSAVHRESPKLGFRHEKPVLGSATRLYSPLPSLQSRGGSMSPSDHSGEYNYKPLGSITGAIILESGDESEMAYTAGNSLSIKNKTAGHDHDDCPLDFAPMDSPTAPSLLDNVYDGHLHSTQRDTPRLGTLLESTSLPSEPGDRHYDTPHSDSLIKSFAAQNASGGQQDDLEDTSSFDQAKPFDFALRAALLSNQEGSSAGESRSSAGHATAKSAAYPSSIPSKCSEGMTRFNALEESQSITSKPYHRSNGRAHADGTSSRILQENRESSVSLKSLQSSIQLDTETHSNAHCVNRAGSRGGATASATSEHSSINASTLYDLPRQIVAQHAASARQAVPHCGEGESVACRTRSTDHASSASTAENMPTASKDRCSQGTLATTSTQGAAGLRSSVLTDAQQGSGLSGSAMVASRKKNMRGSVGTETREKKPPPPRMSHELGVSHRLDGRFDSGLHAKSDGRFIWTDAGEDSQSASRQLENDPCSNGAGPGPSAAPIRDAPSSILVPGAPSSKRLSEDSSTPGEDIRSVGTREDASLEETTQTNLSDLHRSQKNEGILLSEESSERKSRGPRSDSSSSTNAGANHFPSSRKIDSSSDSERAT